MELVSICSNKSHYTLTLCILARHCLYFYHLYSKKSNVIYALCDNLFFLKIVQLAATIFSYIKFTSDSKIKCLTQLQCYLKFIFLKPGKPEKMYFILKKKNEFYIKKRLVYKNLYFCDEKTM